MSASLKNYKIAMADEASAKKEMIAVADEAKNQTVFESPSAMSTFASSSAASMLESPTAASMIESPPAPSFSKSPPVAALSKCQYPDAMKRRSLVNNAMMESPPSNSSCITAAKMLESPPAAFSKCFDSNVVKRSIMRLLNNIVMHFDMSLCAKFYSIEIDWDKQ